MTLWEMSRQYAADAEVFALRIRQLRQQANSEPDPEKYRQLQRRITELLPLLRQSRSLAQVTEHYYERGYRKHAQYQL